MQLSRTEHILAPPDQVWAFLVDVERWPEVMDHMTAVIRLDDGALAVGSAATIQQPRLPAAVWTVDELVPDRRFRWSARSLGLSWSADHVVAEADDGTALTLTVNARGGLSSLMRPLLERAAQQALEAEFAGVRQACTR